MGLEVCLGLPLSYKVSIPTRIIELAAERVKISSNNF